MDYLNEYMNTVVQPLDLEGEAILSEIKQITSEGRSSIVFTINNNSVYINLAGVSDSEIRKKMTAVNIFNTLYSLCGATSKEKYSDVLEVAKSMLSCVVQYKFKETFSENTGKTYKNLVSIKFLRKFEADVPF